MYAQESQPPISEIKQEFESDLARYEGARRKVIISTIEVFQSGDYQKAEQILRDGLYKVEFENHLQGLEICRRLEELANQNPEVKEAFEEVGTLDMYHHANLIQQEFLNNFNQGISLLMSKIRRFGELN